MSNKDFGVVIGIARYPYLKDLQGPVQDAQEFYKWLVESVQIPRNQVKLVPSKDPPERGDRPIQDDIDDAFEDIFNKARQLQLQGVAPRRLYVYFAGHGCAREARHVALLMANAKIGFLNRSMNMELYHDKLIKRAIFPEQVLFYDCCRNYDHRVSGCCTWDDIPPEPGSEAVIQIVLYGAGFTEYANERVDERAFVISERRGLFTKALLEGLKGKAAKPLCEKWIVTSSSLERYVRMRLDELTRSECLKQHLGWNSAGIARDLELVEVDTPGLWDITVTTTVLAGDVVVCDDSLKEVSRQPISGNKLHFQLTQGFYQFQVIPDGPGKLSLVGPNQQNAITL